MSAAARSVATGLRSSWLASETNCRRTASPPSNRSSIAFIVVASRATSSCPGGRGTRSDRSRWLMPSTVRRMRVTGRSARPTNTYVANPTASSSSGPATANPAAAACSVSSPVPRDCATNTVDRRPSTCPDRLVTR